MHIFLLVLVSIIGFFSFNLFLFFEPFFGNNTGIYIPLLMFIFSILIVIFLLIKSYTNDKKIIPLYGIFLILFCIYIFSFTYININEDKNGFLSNNYELKNEFKIKEVSLKNYQDCLNDGNNCHLENMYLNDIDNFQKKIDSRITQKDLFDIALYASNLVTKKKLLNINGYQSSIYIKFDKNEFFKTFIQTHKKNVDGMNLDTWNFHNNFFMNKEQLNSYTNEYYYSIYDKYINSEIDDIKNDKSKKPSFYALRLLFVNREYLYSSSLGTNQMYRNILEAKSLEDNIHQLNK